jgi:hypothetical protein
MPEKHMGEWSYSSIILNLGARWRTASCPSHFTPRERAPSTPRIRGWVGPRAGLYAAEREKSLSSDRNQTLDHCYTIVYLSKNDCFSYYTSGKYFYSFHSRYSNTILMLGIVQ